MKKTTLFILGAILLALIGGWVWYEKNMQIGNREMSEQSQKSENGQANESQQQKEFVVDVDPDVNHWQTKETEFFTIKFPKEWYWLESDPTKQGYPPNSGRSYVITNNPNFNIDKYWDITLGARGSYPLILMNDSEVAMVFSGVSVTPEIGTPRESIDWQIKQVETYANKYENSDTYCRHIHNEKNTPSTAYCYFIDENNQKVQVYYIAYDKITLGFKVWTSTSNNAVNSNLLESIAKSMRTVRN